MRTTAELREGFLSFFEEKGHLRVASASLVPRADDRSTLLTSAGMQPRMGLDWDRVWASVHAGDPQLDLGPDEVTIELWKQVGLPAERIVPLPSSENFWSVGGPGPCGPDSELYWDWGEET